MEMLSERELDAQEAIELADEAGDMVASLELRLQQVRSGVLESAPALQFLSRDSFNLKMAARSGTVPGLAALTHRLDDYLADIQELTEDHVRDLQVFADKIGALLDGEPVETAHIANVVRELPSKRSFDLSDIVVTDVEVTLVMPQRTAARVVERELAACGYRVSIVLDAVEAIGLVVETKPDLVITAMVLPTLSGVDLACALAAMPTTKAIPVALLTSLERDHADLRALPMNAGLIRRGEHFGDDLAEVLQRFDIT